MSSPQTDRGKAPPPPHPKQTAEPKPNGGGGDPINDAPSMAPEHAKIREALNALPPCSAEISFDQWTRMVNAIWAASEGSDEGFAIAAEWMQPSFFFKEEDLLTHWKNCKEHPPAQTTPETLFVLAERAQEAAKQKAEDDQKLKAAARLSKMAYEKKRKELAKELGVRTKVLDEEVAKHREPGEDSVLYPHWKVKPAADAVDTGSLLTDIKKEIERYVATLGKRALVPAAFTMFTWLHEDATHSPLLVATSPEPDSGKTTLVNIVRFMARRSIKAVGLTGAVLFRSIEKWEPTFVIDEADKALENNDDLRTVVNSGWTRGDNVLRCDPDTHEPRPYSTFAAKILAMKKHNGRVALPDTTLSRSIILELKRKTATERVAYFNHFDCEEFVQLRSRLARWAADNADLHKVKPEKPEGFDNRLWENWRVLLAIAERAGVRNELLTAVTEIEGARSEDPAFGEMLLTDIRTIFDAEYPDRKTGADSLFSCTLVEELIKDATQLWAEYYKGKPITQKQLARLLKGYRIFPREVHDPNDNRIHGKGYRREQFEDAWNRYLRETPPSDPRTRAETPPSHPRYRATAEESTTYDDSAEDVARDENTDNPLKTHDKRGSADGEGGCPDAKLSEEFAAELDDICKQRPQGGRREEGKPRFRSRERKPFVWRNGQRYPS